MREPRWEAFGKRQEHGCIRTIANPRSVFREERLAHRQTLSRCLTEKDLRHEEYCEQIASTRKASS